MTGMPIGLITLVVLSILIFFGIGQRALDRLHLSDKAALFFILAMFVGTFIPDIPITNRVRLNIGGTIIPLILCIYVLVKAERNKERIRALIATVVTTGAIYAVSKYLPAEPEAMFIDPNYLYAIVAAVVAYIIGRSRRAAFVAGVLGVILNDVIYLIEVSLLNIDTTVSFGGAGVFDTTVLAGILAVLLAEFFGEARERMRKDLHKSHTSKKSLHHMADYKATSSLASWKDKDEEGQK